MEPEVCHPVNSRPSQVDHQDFPPQLHFLFFLGKQNIFKKSFVQLFIMVPFVLHFHDSPQDHQHKVLLVFACVPQHNLHQFCIFPPIVQLNKSFLDYKVHVSLEVPFGSSKNSFYFLSHSVLVFFFLLLKICEHISNSCANTLA